MRDIYIIESSKGYQSLKNFNIKNEDLLIFVGKLANLKSDIKCGIIRVEKLSHIKKLGNIKNIRSIYTTDDCFNIFSFKIINYVNRFNNTYITYINHHKNMGVEWSKRFNIRSYYRFFKIFICNYKYFESLQFTNFGVSNRLSFGYRLYINYDRVLFTKEFATINSCLKKIDANVIILIPQYFNDKADKFIGYVDELLSSIDLDRKKVAYKMHPRAGLNEQNLIKMTSKLRKCVMIEKNNLIEDFDLNNKIILNLTSSFRSSIDSKVYLFAKIFECRDVDIKFLTGTVDFKLFDIEKEITSHASR